LTLSINSSILSPHSSPVFARGSRSAGQQVRLLALRVSLFSIALLGAASLATAQLPGTLFGIIQDENGETVPDVVIDITDPERADFSMQVTSDKRGKYRVFVQNATVPYTFKFSKSGYQEFELNGVKISAKKDTRRNFTIKTQAAALADAQAAGTVDPDAAAKGAATEIYNQGVVALNGGDLDTAETYFLSALEKKPDLALAHAALARLYLRKEAHAKAAEQAELAVAADVDVDSMQQVLYSSYTALGEADKAEIAMRKMQAANPERASINLFNQAADAYNNGDMAAAKEGLTGVLSANPDHAKANYMLGLVLIGEGDSAGAKNHLERFLALAPEDPDAGTAREMLQYLDN
jgi:tetratricopeptide (TPR) repeat protein